MWDKFYIGLDLTGFENNGIQRPISRVTLQLDGENVLTAGDDSGLELTADCPHATQAMVNSLLAQLKGSTYKMYSAADANLDPSAELGDGITASGVYSVISRLADDGMGYPSPSAPGKEELEDEYPAGGPMTQAFDRKISETRSTITKTAEQIKLEVQKIENDIVTLGTTFTVELGKITSSIQDIDGKYSKLEQSINGFSLSVSNGETSSTIKLMAGEAVIDSQDITMSGFVTFKGLESGETTIDGGCLKTGTIESMKINSSTITGGKITGASITGGSLKSEGTKGGAIASIILEKGMISFWYHDQKEGEIKANSGNGGIRIEANQVVDIDVDGQDVFRVSDGESGFYTNLYERVFCYNDLDLGTYQVVHISDKRLKSNIQKSDIYALDVINSIQTYHFDWKETGQHEKLGFIAQQLKSVSDDFVNVNAMDGYYRTKDIKIIPYLVKAVQELSAKLDGQKGARP